MIFSKFNTKTSIVKSIKVEIQKRFTGGKTLGISKEDISKCACKLPQGLNKYYFYHANKCLGNPEKYDDLFILGFPGSKNIYTVQVEEGTVIVEFVRLQLILRLKNNKHVPLQ